MTNEVEYDCPICVTIPSGKIFQCREGHIICESCLLKIRGIANETKIKPKCPSCAESIDQRDVSRCRVLENILDRLTIECYHAKDGCEEKFKRSEAKEHETSCPYGQSHKICWRFLDGYCNFKLSLETADSFLQHVKANHSSIICEGTRSIRISHLKEMWRCVVTTGCAWSYMDILKIPTSQRHIAVITTITKEKISFCSIDLFLSLSVTDKVQVIVSIPNKSSPLLMQSFVAAKGVKSWRFMGDKICQDQIEIDINSVLQHCNEDEKVTLDVQVKPT